MRVRFLFFVLFLVTSCATQQGQRFVASDDELVYFTTQSIRENLHDIHPMIQPFFWDNGPFNKLYGVAGAMGTLSRFSPYGNRGHNVSPYLNFGWQDFQEFLTSIGGRFQIAVLIL